MSTYLQLCSQLRQECEVGGTGPSAVLSQTGVLARLVTWIADEYTELQQEKDWKWLHKYFTVSATSGDGVYVYTDCTDTVTSAAIDRFSKWHKYEFSCYLSSAGVGAEYPLIWTEWEDFRLRYRIGTQTNSSPRHVSVDNNLNIVLGPIPDDTYVVSGGYQRGPQILAADGDEPEMPSRFHKLIIYDAMTRYGSNSIAQELLVRAASEASRLRFALMRDQLPSIRAGDSAA